MKKKLLLTSLAGFLIYVLLTGYAEGPAITGSINGTGSTGVTGCSCHNPSATAATLVQVQLYDATGTTLVTGGYVGGTTYQIKLTGSQTNLSLTHFGFELSVVKLAGAGTGSAVNAGTMSAPPSGTHIHTLGGIDIFEHYNGGSPAAVPGVLSGSVYNYAETITWTAPVAGTGSVRIYAVINAVNHSGTAGAPDAWNTTSITVAEAVAVQPITGNLTVCAGSTTQLSNATPGGTWSSASPGVATVNVSSGLVSGVTAGTAVISYVTSAGHALATVTVVPLPNAGSISGPSAVCEGATINLTDAASGGTWSSSNNSIATVNAAGVVTGVGAGAVNISYTVTNGCGTDEAIHAVTVNPAPDAGAIVNGSSSICVGSNTAFSNTAGSGMWSSSNTTIATVDAAGVVTGTAAGSITLSYSVTNGCGTDVAITTVNVTTVATAGTITGPTHVCAGGTITLSDGVAGGVWSSVNTTTATVNSSGVVTGAAAGATDISYTVNSSCGTASTGVTITVELPLTVSAITGTDSVCVGQTITLSNATAGGMWSTQNTNATVSAGGVVTGVVPGFDSIKYTLNNSCGSVYAAKNIKIKSCTSGINSANDITIGLRVYPNPAEDGITISVPEFHEPGTVTITDMAGRTMLRIAMNKQSVFLDIKDLPAGSYALRVSAGDVIYRQQIVKK